MYAGIIITKTGFEVSINVEGSSEYDALERLGRWVVSAESLINKLNWDEVDVLAPGINYVSHREVTADLPERLRMIVYTPHAVIARIDDK